MVDHSFAARFDFMFSFFSAIMWYTKAEHKHAELHAIMSNCSLAPSMLPESKPAHSSSAAST
jgi:hypothetical protein